MDWFLLMEAKPGGTFCRNETAAELVGEFGELGPHWVRGRRFSGVSVGWDHGVVEWWNDGMTSWNEWLSFTAHSELEMIRPRPSHVHDKSIGNGKPEWGREGTGTIGRTDGRSIRADRRWSAPTRWCNSGETHERHSSVSTGLDRKQFRSDASGQERTQGGECPSPRRMAHSPAPGRRMLMSWCHWFISSDGGLFFSWVAFPGILIRLDWIGLDWIGWWLVNNKLIDCAVEIVMATPVTGTNSSRASGRISASLPSLFRSLPRANRRLPATSERRLVSTECQTEEQILRNVRVHNARNDVTGDVTEAPLAPPSAGRRRRREKRRHRRHQVDVSFSPPPLLLLLLLLLLLSNPEKESHENLARISDPQRIPEDQLYIRILLPIQNPFLYLPLHFRSESKLTSGFLYFSLLTPLPPPRIQQVNVAAQPLQQHVQDALQQQQQQHQQHQQQQQQQQQQQCDGGDVTTPSTSPDILPDILNSHMPPPYSTLPHNSERCMGMGPMTSLVPHNWNNFQLPPPGGRRYVAFECFNRSWHPAEGFHLRRGEFFPSVWLFPRVSPPPPPILPHPPSSSFILPPFQFSKGGETSWRADKAFWVALKPASTRPHPGEERIVLIILHQRRTESIMAISARCVATAQQRHPWPAVAHPIREDGMRTDSQNWTGAHLHASSRLFGCVFACFSFRSLPH